MLFRNPLCLTVVLVALLNAVPFRICFKDESKDMEGFIYLGSYHPPNKTLKRFSRSDKTFSDSQYFVSQGAASWIEATADCKRRSDSNGNKTGLLWFSTPEELEHIAEMLSNRFPGPIGQWTSGIYSKSQGKWIWETTSEDVPSWVPWKGGATPDHTDSSSRLLLSVYNELDFFIDAETQNATRRYICKGVSLV